MKPKNFEISDQSWQYLSEIKEIYDSFQNSTSSWDNIVEELIITYIEKIKEQEDKEKAAKNDPHYAPPPPKKSPIKIDISTTHLAELAKKETKETKFILIECQICGSKPIMMPVPKKAILTAKEPVVDIAYTHGNPEHVVVAQLDHDFQVRRRRACEVVYEKDYHEKKPDSENLTPIPKAPTIKKENP
jgi:hypothetical protein